MYLKRTGVEVDSEDPFKNDKLSRRESAEVLTQLLLSISEPFVLSIDAPWGTGKTTFVRMWEQHLKNEGFHCLYFNAWEKDFANDPLIALIGELQSEIVSAMDEEKSTAKRHFDEVKRAGESLARRAVPVAIKIVTSGVLDLDDVIEANLADFAAEWAQEKMSSYESDKRSLETFKEKLESFALELADDEGKPLVFFVDELDRCRPTYAIELLERIKHLFNVRGIIFVLVIDRQEAANSIQTRYGIADTDGYLRRFIDLEYRLPEASREEFIRYLINRFRFEQFFDERSEGRRERELLLETFTKLANMFSFSLRVQEQCFTQLSIVLRTTPVNHVLYAPLAAFLIALKAANHELYRGFITESTSPQKVIEHVEAQPGGQEFLRRFRAVKEHILIANDGREALSQRIEELQAKTDNEELTDDERFECNQSVKTLKQIRLRRHHELVSHLAKKIQISERFTFADS